jgi:hypothetical protein
LVLKLATLPQDVSEHAEDDGIITLVRYV